MQTFQCSSGVLDQESSNSTAYAGTIFRFCVAFFVITYTGVGAVAIGFPNAPGVFARVCFAIFGKADLTHGGRCTIRLPKIGSLYSDGLLIYKYKKKSSCLSSKHEDSVWLIW